MYRENVLSLSLASLGWHFRIYNPLVQASIDHVQIQGEGRYVRT